MAESTSAAESKLVANFLELIGKGKYNKAADAWLTLLNQVGSSKRDITVEELTKLSVQPSKAFKKVTLLMSSPAAVAGLLSLALNVSPAKLEPLLEGLMKLASSPKFAQQLVACGCAKTIRETCEMLFSRLFGVSADIDKHGDYFPAVLTLVPLCVSILETAPNFLEEADKERVLMHVLRFFPSALDPRGEVAKTDTFLCMRLSLLDASADLFHHFMRGGESRWENMDEGVIREVRNYFRRGFACLKETATLSRSRAVVEEVRSCFQALLKAPKPTILLSSPLSDVLKKGVRDVIPYVDEPTKGAGLAFLEGLERCSDATASKSEPAAKRDPKELLAECKALIEQLNKGSKEDRKRTFNELNEIVEGFDFGEEYCYLFQPFVLQILTDFLTEGLSEVEDATERYPRHAEKPIVSQEVFKVLMTLDCFTRGYAVLTSVAKEVVEATDIFDYVGCQVLDWAVDKVPVINGLNYSELLSILMNCFKEGAPQLQVRGVELMDLVLGTLEPTRLRDDQGMNLGWHFLSVLLGENVTISEYVLEDFGKHGFRDVFPKVIENRARASEDDDGVPDCWDELEMEQLMTLARLGLEALSQGSSRPSVDHLPAYTYEVASIILMCSYEPEVLRKEVVPKVGTLVSILAMVYSKFSEVLRASAESGTSEGDGDGQETRQSVKARGGFLSVRCPLETVEEAGNLLCETFTRILKLVHDSETEAREVEGMLRDIAQNGGLELCVKIVQDERRGLHGPHAMPDEREWVKELQSLANRCWATFSKDFNLKRCSYEACSNGVLEMVKGSFKKCSACGLVQYCSRECQKNHWRDGHKDECQR